MDKIKLEASGPVKKCYKACYQVHTDMAGGYSVTIYTWSSTCLMLHLEFHVWVTVQIKAAAFIYDCICSVSWGYLSKGGYYKDRGY